MYSDVVRLYTPRYYVYESVGVLISKVSVQFISDRSMGPFHDCTLDVRVPAHVKIDALLLQHVLKRYVQKFFEPIRLCRLRTVLEYLGSIRKNMNFDVT